MTPFSSVLEVYMKEKEIRTYSIAEFCGIDRSNMYKIISGKRNPTSEEMVGKIAEYMRLKPVERNHLIEAYQITIMGYDTYHRRKCVQDFLMSFSGYELEVKQKQIQQEYVTLNIDEEKLLLRQGSVAKDKQLKNLISSVLNIEIQKNAGNICLLMQPENNDIMDILSLEGAKKKNLNIEHIFCLSNTNDIVTDNKDYNLNCLNHILPMFIQCVCDYKPYCYYDNITSHNNRFNLLTSMILTSEYAVIFSMEEKYGMLFTEKESIQYLHTLFRSLKEETTLIARKMDSLENQLSSFENIDFSDRGIGFQPEGCLVPMIPQAFLEKYLKRELLSQQPVRDRLFQYIRCIEQTMSTSKMIFLFTENGIRRFADTGRISELPESVYYPLEYNDRLLLIRRLIKECESGRYQMLCQDAPIAENEVCLYSAVQDGYLLIPTLHGDRIFIELRESGLLYAFRDYFENLDRRYFYSPEEATSILKLLLKRKPV